MSRKTFCPDCGAPKSLHAVRCRQCSTKVSGYRESKQRARDALTARLAASFEERFWARVDKSDGCWLWIASRDTAGYGHLSRHGRLVRASRVAFELASGPIPAGMAVCHRCDNPPCVRPDHLFLGTLQDNMLDAVAKGRAYRGGAHTPTRGTRSARAKLTEAQVAEMRATYSGRPGEQREMARRYGVDRSTVSKILTRPEMWPHVQVEKGAR